MKIILNKTFENLKHRWRFPPFFIFLFNFKANLESLNQSKLYLKLLFFEFQEFYLIK